MNSSASVRIWLLSALALCAVPAARRLSHGAEQFRLPATPLDQTSASGTRQWAFLQECRGHLPPKASVTVLAADPAEEGALFMMALGLYPDHPTGSLLLLRDARGDGCARGVRPDLPSAARPADVEIVAEWKGGAVDGGVGGA
jgi:hypothetical protein